MNFSSFVFWILYLEGLLGVYLSFLAFLQTGSLVPRRTVFSLFFFYLGVRG